MACNIQLSASQHDEHVYDTRKKGSLGIFCVRLDNITVGELTKREQFNVKRLQGIFKEQGCLPLDQLNHIKAAIDNPTWEAAAARLQHSRRREGFPQELFLRADEYVDCKQGKCRIEAARAFLQDPFRWWTVSLYKKGNHCTNILRFLPRLNCQNRATSYFNISKMSSRTNKYHRTEPYISKYNIIL